MKSLFIKLVSSTALMLISVPIWAAQSASANTFTSSQLYAGVQAGYISSKSSELFSISGFGSFEESGGVTGGAYGAFLGYQTPAWKSVNLALEGFYDYSHANSLGLKQTGDWGLSLLPGYLISDNAKIYARLGYINTRLQAEDVKNNLDGYQLGLGYLHGLGDNFGVRAEYDYSSYQSINVPLGLASSMKLRYSSNIFKIGFEWMLAI